jgi:hypothetical protein
MEKWCTGLAVLPERTKKPSISGGLKGGVPYGPFRLFEGSLSGGRAEVCTLIDSLITRQAQNTDQLALISSVI